MSPFFDLARKPAPVTGSGHGIGFALTAGLAARGERSVIGGCDAIEAHLNQRAVEATIITAYLAGQSLSFVSGHKLHVDVGITSI